MTQCTIRLLPLLLQLPLPYRIPIVPTPLIHLTQPIVETWLDDQILNTDICVDGYNIVRLDRNRQGGGVLIFVSKAFSYNLVHSGSPELELIVLSLQPPQSPIITTNAPISIFDTLLNSLCLYVTVSYLILCSWETSMLIF